MTRETYRHWLAVARRLARRGDEAEDLLHEALLVAARAGRGDLTQTDSARWFSGVLRNLAAMQARSAVRRRARETAAASDEGAEAPEEDGAPALALPELPRALRQVAALALHGMTRAEIAWALRLNDAALRQRISGLRKALSRWMASAPPTPAVRPLASGRMRQSLLDVVRRRGALGTHDPDGHLIAIREIGSASRPRAPRQQDR